jgi:DNA polymerase III subunit epsilon
MFTSSFAVVDLETTGMTATVDRITEIGILTVVDGKVVEEWSTLVNPECSIPAEIQSLTGISNAMVRDAPTFRDLAAAVHARLINHIFVAHNARFDYGFLKNEFRRLDLKFTADVLCTVRLSRRLYPAFKSHSLDALRERHQLTTDHRHRALGDARAAWQFIETAMREHGADEMASAVNVLLKMPSLPPQLSPGALDDLPEGPGVYTFYGVNDLPIYIGKGNNIRSRVRAHFSSDHRSANDQRLSVEIRRIAFEETAGELGALLRESTLVKTQMPLRNHALRRNQALAFVRLKDSASLPDVIAVNEVDFADTDNLFGPFPSKSRARAALLSLAADHGLCYPAKNQAGRVLRINSRSAVATVWRTRV